MKEPRHDQVSRESRPGEAPSTGPAASRQKAKFQLAGWEAVDKMVAPSGGSGRVYLPIAWLGKKVKVIRLD